MAVEIDVKKSDIPMSPVKKGHTTVWHLQKMKDEGVYPQKLWED